MLAVISARSLETPPSLVLMSELLSVACRCRYLVALFAAYPLAAVFAAIPPSLANVKHAFSLVTGVVLAQLVFGTEWVHALISSTVVYLLLAATKNSRAVDRVRHVVIFAFMLLYLAALHTFRMYHDYMGWTLDITGAFMLLTMKLSSVGYNYYDGVVNPMKAPASLKDAGVKVDEKTAAELQRFGGADGVVSAAGGVAAIVKQYQDVSKASGDGRRAAAEALKAATRTLSASNSETAASPAVARLLKALTDGVNRVEQLREDRQLRALVAMPTPLEFFGWVFCFATFFAGPAFELSEYLAASRRDLSTTTSRAAAVVKALLSGVLFLALTGYGQGAFPFLVGSAPNIIVNPRITEQSNLLATAGIALVCLFFVRAKYYFAWLVTEGAAILAGFGYTEQTRTWDGVSNVDVLRFEFASNISNGSKAWNQVRLAQCVCVCVCVYVCVCVRVCVCSAFSSRANGAHCGVAMVMCSARKAGSSATCSSAHRGRTTCMLRTLSLHSGTGSTLGEWAQCALQPCNVARVPSSVM
jgi:hypothetical protein